MEVAKKYAISDAMLRRVCREMEIPTPPVGYWAKKQAGQEVPIPPLPPSNCRSVKFGLRSQKQNAMFTEDNAAGASNYVPTIQEETASKMEEERKRKEEQKRQYNQEVTRINELLNQAEDYEMACRIRAMVTALEQKGVADTQWIAWAEAKADWFDPTVAAKDPILGRRNHKCNGEQKALKVR